MRTPAWNLLANALHPQTPTRVGTMMNSIEQLWMIADQLHAIAPSLEQGAGDEADKLAGECEALADRIERALMGEGSSSTH